MAEFVKKLAKNDAKWRKYANFDMFCHNYYPSGVKMLAKSNPRGIWVLPFWKTSYECKMLLRSELLSICRINQGIWPGL
jgi:hypothetical protein